MYIIYYLFYILYLFYEIRFKFCYFKYKFKKLFEFLVVWTQSL